jgi:hypothetical protein
VDINKLESVGDTLTTRDGLDFAGWFTDASCEIPFYDSKYTRITSNTVIYAGWNTLLTSYDFVHTESPGNGLQSCTFTNTTGTADTTMWIVKDAFKTSGLVPLTETADRYTVGLLRGMYEVTMTVTDVNGEKKVLSKTEKVTGTITDAVTWNDYSSAATQHTITYTLDVEEYIKYAKMNRVRDFRIANIANHATPGADVVQNIANELKALPYWSLPSTTGQDRANLIASFVNEGLSYNGGSDGDSRYYRIQGVHMSPEQVEYYRYPAEALYDRKLFNMLGDCDCHAIITAAIAKACGFDSAVLVMTNTSEKEGHAIAGIKGDFIKPPEQSIPTLNGKASFNEEKGYYSCETFRKGWKLWVGNVDADYIGNGWTWNAFPVK